MKLKPVVASLVMLGLMTPVFAKSSLASQQAIIDSNSVTSPVCPEGWSNRISIGGVGSIVGITGNHDHPGTFTNLGNASDMYVNDANLLLNANLSSWSKATVNLAYLCAPVLWNNVGKVQEAHDKTKYISSYRQVLHTVVADEVYVQIGNLQKYPFYFAFGKKYLPFGEYTDAHVPIQIMSPVQAMTQVNAVAAIAGLSTNFGLYGSVFAFRGETYPINSQVGTIRNFGAKLGYYNSLDALSVPGAHVNFNISYLNNIWDAKFFSPNVYPQLAWNEKEMGSEDVKAYHPILSYKTLNGANKSEYSIDSVGAVAVHADFAYKAFTLSANFASALKKMVLDTYSPTQYNASKLWAADVGANYSFKTFDHHSHLGAGIQFTGNGAWFGDNEGYQNKDSTDKGGITDWCKIMPKWRLLGEYKVNLFKNTDLGLVIAHSKSYDFVNVDESVEPKGARNTTVGLARLMVQF